MTEDARPPPGDCMRLSETLDAHRVGDLRRLLAEHPTSFDLLLLHAQACSTCRAFIDQAFPEGFSSPETEAGLDEAVERLTAEHVNTAETPPGSSPEGETGS